MKPNPNNYIGRTNVANNGQQMKIIAYRNSHDLDVQFEDGEIVRNKLLSNFSRGAISNPKVCVNKSHLGESMYSKYGMNATIIAYRAYNDIDVQFEDGYIAKNASYDTFKRDKILNKNIASNPAQVKALKERKERIGQEIRANNGQKMTIIEYRSSSDIDIRFEDGTVVIHKDYYRFTMGNIANPTTFSRAKEHNSRWNNRLGEEAIASNGQKMRIIRYNGTKDIDIQFEDGTIVKNKEYNNFKRGKILNPNKPIKETIYASDKIGMTNVNNSGMGMKIVEANTRYVTVEFEDKTIVKTSFRAFLNGQVRCKSELEDKLRKEKLSQLHIGEKWKDKNNETITIVERVITGKNCRYRVSYDDNTEVIGSYNSIKNGKISRRFASKIGLKSLHKSGEVMTIIDYRNSHDIDIQFEDGTIVKNRGLSDFYRGLISKDYTNYKKLREICEKYNINYDKVLVTKRSKNISVKQALTIVADNCYINILGDAILITEDGTTIVLDLDTE